VDHEHDWERISELDGQNLVERQDMRYPTAWHADPVPLCCKMWRHRRQARMIHLPNGVVTCWDGTIPFV
jgi:hypothetical protein